MTTDRVTRDGARPSGATRIVAAEAVRVRVPLRRPWITSAGSWTEHDAWILRLREATGREGIGREGIGEACLGPGAAPSLVAELAELVPKAVAGLVVGDDAIGPTPGGSSVSPGVLAAVRAAVASASLGPDERRDATARPTVEVNATIATEDTEASVTAATEAVGAGFRTLKLKGGSEPSTDALVERLVAVRAAVGAGIALRLDVNGAWDPATAEERLAALAEHELEYVEDPLPGVDPNVVARLRSRSSVPIAIDEAVTAPEAARALLAASAADVLVLKPTRVGGPAAALAIAEAAASVGVPVVVSTLLETGVGSAAALWTAARLPDAAGAHGHFLAHGLATGAVLEHDLLATPLTPAGGRLLVPDGPGLGVTLDEAALARYAVARVAAGEPWR